MDKEFNSFKKFNSPMKPKIAPRLTKQSLIVIVNLLVAHAAGVDRRRVRILWIEDHRRICWIDFTRAHGHRLRTRVHAHLRVRLHLVLIHV